MGDTSARRASSRSIHHCRTSATPIRPEMTGQPAAQTRTHGKVATVGQVNHAADQPEPVAHADGEVEEEVDHEGNASGSISPRIDSSDTALFDGTQQNGDRALIQSLTTLSISSKSLPGS